MSNDYRGTHTAPELTQRIKIYATVITDQGESLPREIGREIQYRDWQDGHNTVSVPSPLEWGMCHPASINRPPVKDRADLAKLDSIVFAWVKDGVSTLGQLMELEDLKQYSRRAVRSSLQRLQKQGRVRYVALQWVV